MKIVRNEIINVNQIETFNLCGNLVSDTEANVTTVSSDSSHSEEVGLSSRSEPKF